MAQRINYVRRMYKVGEYNLREAIRMMEAAGLTEAQAIAALLFN